MNSITRAFWPWWSPLMEWWRCVETKNEKIQVKSFPISLQIVCTLTHTSHKSLWEWKINNWQVFGDTLSRTAMMEGINVKKVIFLVPLFPSHSQRDLWDLCGSAHTIWSEMWNYFTWFFLFFCSITSPSRSKTRAWWSSLMEPITSVIFPKPRGGWGGQDNLSHLVVGRG